MTYRYGIELASAMANPRRSSLKWSSTMSRFISSVKRSFAVFGLLLVAGAASANPIDFDQWYTFGFQNVGDPLISGSGFVLGDRSVAAPDPAWTFTCPASHCKIRVTDGFLAVDQFELFDFGVSLGLTSVPSGDSSHSCGTDELGCLADDQMSHGFFTVGAGDHSITGLHQAGIPGAGFLIVKVPEPATVLLIALGLLMLGMSRRRA
jgi:hypothetical protein